MLRVLLLLSVSILAVNSAESDVLDLGDNDFENKIADHETTLVMFYAPWCGHCKRLKPEFAKAAELLKDSEDKIVLAKVDCTEAGKETCNKFSVSGYPTLKIFRNGELSKDYNGPREADGIVKYMKAQVGPASREISKLDDFEKFIGNKDPTIFGFFESDSDLKKAFLKYADKKREKLRFGHTSAKDILEKQAEKDAVYIFKPPHLHNKFEDSFVKFEGSSYPELTDFVTDKIHGLVGHRTRESSSDFSHPMVVAYYEVDYAKNPKGTNYWRNRILKVAKEFESLIESKKIRFAVSAKADFQHELNEYGYDFVGDKPIILARDEKNLKYSMKDEFSIDNLRNFVNALLEGELEPFIKSEPVPESNAAPVKVAVAKNFDELVLNNEKDTLVEFYAPWCGHCKKLTPVYEEVATKLADEDVVLVKMDATANDVPVQFEVSGFPTLFWLPKDEKDKPVTYKGGRDVDDFIKYIAKQATNELKGFDRDGKPKKTEL